MFLSSSVVSRVQVLLQVHDQLLLLKRLYSRQLGLSEARLRAAVSYGGNPERLQRVLQKLIRGRPVNIATIGGSVTGVSIALSGCGLDVTSDLIQSDCCCSRGWSRYSQPFLSRTIV